jgi:hypothetical protein
MPDWRQAEKVIYLDEILLLCVLANLARTETFTGITHFDEQKLALLRRFRPFEDGVPAHDQRVTFYRPRRHRIQRCCVAWAAALTKSSAEVIAIDAKTLRRSN